MTRRTMTWLLALAFWTACGLVCGLQIWMGMLDHGHFVPLLLFYQVLVWNGWLAIAPVVRWLVRKRPLIPPTFEAALVHIAAALVIAVVHSAYWAMLMVTLRPYDVRNVDSFRHAFGPIVYSGLPLELLLYCGVLVSAYAFEYYEKYREQVLQASRLEASLAEARLHALELQIQPHFLFNTLNAISSLVRTSRNDEAVVMIAGLSDLLRYTLDHAGGQRVTLDEEVGVLRRYLDLQRARFPDRLTFDIDVDAAVRGAQVPTLLLQPLAENAIRHGISRSASEGRVEIRAFPSDEMVRIEMFNTGTLGVPSERGVGLRNTAERLKQLYGDRHHFELRNDRGGVVAIVDIPRSDAA